MFAAPNAPRSHYAALYHRLGEMGADELERRHRAADLMMRQQGITFTVYGRDQGVEQIIPFDPVPRLVAADEWATIERGLTQRVRALNLFIHDVYHNRAILRDRAVPADLVLGSSGFRRECTGLRVPKDIYIHISGIDLIRDATGQYLVLEDNARTPSGVSYVLKNRQVMKQAFPKLFGQYNVRAVDDYASNLLAMLRHIAPPGSDDPTVVVLTPGVYNSAYYEHSFLARQMGVELVEGRDLFFDGGQIFMRTTQGPKRVDVIYRRVDDDYLDPLTFRRDSQLGVAGLIASYRAGQIGLANALGTGVADDKGIYPFVPEIIKYYLGEDPILANVETFRASIPAPAAAHPGQPRQARGQDRRWFGRLRDADRSRLHRRPARRFRREDRGEPPPLHRPADHHPEPASDPGRRPPRRAARRPPPVHPLRRGDQGPGRRPDPGGAAEGEPGRQQLAGGRDQGYLGSPRDGRA